MHFKWRAFLILLLFPTVIRAQHWQQVNVPPGPHSLSPYFISRDYGFLYTSGISDLYGVSVGWWFSFIDTAAVYRTTNGGSTWNAMNVGELTTASHAVITQMYFISPAHGYMTAVVNDTPSFFYGGLYETRDSGKHWNRITPPRFGFESLAISGAEIFLEKFGIAGWGPDSTVVFDTSSKLIREVFGGCPSIVSNKQKIVYAHHIDYNNPTSTSPDGFVLRSSDEGLFWANTESGAPSIESWSMYAIPNSAILLRAAEKTQAVVAGSEIQRSTDGGVSWRTVYSFGQTGAIGDIGGDGCAIYFQTTRAASPDSGLFRSTDSGITWQKIGGPIHRGDSRSISVVDAGAVVYAVDDSDWWNDQAGLPAGRLPFVKLWRTTDGGDGSLPRAYNPSLTSDSIPRISLCNLSQALVNVSSNRCSIDWTLDSVILEGDTSDFRLDSIPALPETFGGAASDSFHILFAPVGHTGPFTGSIHLHFSLLPPASGAYDTTITIIATAVASPIDFASSISSIDFGSVSTCNSNSDTLVVFTNKGCSPDTITRARLAGSGFSDTSDTLPIVVQPGDSAAFHYRFVPPDSGSYSGTVTLHVTSMGLTEDPVIALSGRAVQGEGVLAVASTSLQAGSFSFCAGDTVLTDTLRNTGCDTLVLSNIRFGGDTAFMLIASPDSLLVPGASGVFEFQFAPRLKGPHSAMLTFHSQNIANDTGTNNAVTIFGAGLGGKTALSLDTTPRDFGSLFVCQSRDTTIWLSNPGCDTLKLERATFSNPAYTTDTAFPIAIPAEDSVPVRVTLTGSADMNGTVTFVSNANTGLDTGTVPLRAALLPPARLQLLLSPAQSAYAGQVVTFYVIFTGDTGMAANALSGISFDLTHNDNLLALQNVTGLTWLPGAANSTRTDTFAWKVGLEAPTYADTIGILRFKVYLTDSSTTPLTLSNIALSANGIEPDCIASVDSNGSGFTYLYQCGEGEIQGFLRSGAISFGEPNYPNPLNAAGGFKTTVPFTTYGSGVASIRIVDAVGKVVLSDNEEATHAGQHFFYFTAEDLPSGTYYYTIEFPKGVVIASKTMLVVK